MAIQMYARYEVEVVGYTTDSVQIRFTAGSKDLCCWVPRDSLPLEEPIGGKTMSNDEVITMLWDQVRSVGELIGMTTNSGDLATLVQVEMTLLAKLDKIA